MLKSGGTLIISVPFYNDRLKAIDKAHGITEPNKNENEFYQWRLETKEILNEFKINGFECKHVQPIFTREGLGRHMYHQYGIPYGKLRPIIFDTLVPICQSSEICAYANRSSRQGLIQKLHDDNFY